MKKTHLTPMLQCH